VTTVDQNRLKGNYGAALVSLRLSSECLVRPVAADTDVGVDLYCESVDEGTPFLHFWVQVKTGGQCRTSTDGTSASCNFDTKHLRYWERQPVPVFAALVPCEWPVSTEPDIFIVDITSFILFRGIPSNQNHVSIESSCHWAAGQQEPILRFLKDVVPGISARLAVSKGLVAEIPTLSHEYIRSTPYVPVSRYIRQILRQLRTTAAKSILFLLSSAEIDVSNMEHHQTLARVVEVFGDDPHWENFMARGLSYHADGSFDEARAMYQRAIDTINADDNLKDLPEWQSNIKRIRQYLADATNRILIVTASRPQ